MISRQRPCAIIVQNDKILLMKRIRDNETYFTFPGGHVEENEDLQATLKREIKEELNFDISNFKEVFRIIQFIPPRRDESRENIEIESIFYLVFDFKGELQLGGPEIERMKTGKNNYYPTWYNKVEFSELDPIYPVGIKEFVLDNLLS